MHELKKHYQLLTGKLMANNNDAVLEELIAIKKLLMMMLYAAGIPSEEIDKAAKMGAANIRALCSKKKAKITVRLAKDKEDN